MPQVREIEGAMPSTKVGMVIMVALFLSGMTAIAYEIIWQRLLVRTMGATLPAVSSIFCVFIAGLYLGTLISIPLLRQNRSPLRLYAFIELGIAAFGIFIPAIFNAYVSEQVLQSICVFLHQAAATSSDVELMSSLLQNALYFIVLFLPALFMGVTFNCVTRHIEGSQKSSQRTAFSLSTGYVVNLFGGAFGCLISSYFLIPHVGLTITSMSMALVNLVVFFLLFASSLLSQPADDPFAELLAMFSPPKVTPHPTNEIGENNRIGEKDDNAVQKDAGASKLRQNSEVAQPQSLLFALALVLICSGVIMALEVTWTRLMMLLLGSSTYSVSGVLFTAFLAFAFSALIVERLIDKDLVKSIPQLIMLSSLCIVAGQWLVPYVPVILIDSQRSLTQLPLGPLTLFLIPRLLICAFVVMPPLLLLGMIFPILLALSEKNKTSAKNNVTIDSGPDSDDLQDLFGSSLKRTTVVGALMATSAAGSIAGCLVAAFVLIPQSSTNVSGSQSGIETALSTISIFLLLMSVSTHVSMRDKKKTLRSFALRSQIFMFCCFLTGFATCLRPPWDLLLLALGPTYFQIPQDSELTQAKLITALRLGNGGNALPLFYKEGSNSTVSVEQNLKANIRYLKNNGKIEAALPIDWGKPAATSDAATQLILSCLPFFFLDKKENVDALIIGYGSGITAGGVDCRPEIRSLKIAELEPAVYRASRCFIASNLDPFKSARRGLQRVSGLIVDARSFLRIHQNFYDVIISQPSEPWISGASDLFTREFWQLSKSRLAAGGVMCQWIQIYCIDQKTLKTLLATFTESFPNSYLVHPNGAGEVLLIGVNASLEQTKRVTPTVPLLNNFFQASGLFLAPRLSPGNVHLAPPPLLCDFVFGPEQLRKITAGSQINTDDRLLPEYSLPRQAVLKNDNVSENLHWLRSQ